MSDSHTGGGKPGGGKPSNGKPATKKPHGVVPMPQPRAPGRIIVMDVDEAHPPGAVTELAANCVRFVLSKMNIELDFKHDTLSLLDHYVAEARADIKGRPEALALTAHAIGAYLGEVVRKSHHTCWWRIDHDDPGAWRLEFRTIYLAFYPVQVAYAALTKEEDEANFSGFELTPDDRSALASRLADLPSVDEDEYFAPSTRLDLLDIAVDALLAKRAQSSEMVRPFEPSDYE